MIAPWASAELDAARAARELADLRALHAGRVFLPYFQPRDGLTVDAQILAARVLGVRLGDPGPRLPEEACRRCWGDRHVWLGDGWGIRHTHERERRRKPCRHDCHNGEHWAAGIRRWRAEPLPEMTPAPTGTDADADGPENEVKDE